MLFNSAVFLLIFLPLTLIAYWLVDRHERLRIAVLLFFSFAFYGLWNPEFVPLMAGLIVINWATARWYTRIQDGRIVTTAIIATLGVLAVYKYADFLINSFSALMGIPPRHLGLGLPVGISFFTFHHIMYLIDLRRGRASPTSIDRYALYICFFPQAAAGPLARWSEIGAQLGQSAFREGWERRWALAITFIVIGLVEKVALGDPIGQLINPTFQAATAGPVLDGSAWLSLGFGLQIYFDFAGYSNMAIGIALLFGVRLPENFHAPFQAPSIIAFWQRWHMTLSRFLRDYVFLPLADMRIAGTRHTTAQYVMAILATMALCGLWHGAGWNFVLWGLLHGVAIVVALGWRRVGVRLPRLLGWALTVSFFLLSGILFRTTSLDHAWNLFAGLTVLPEPKLLGKAWIIGIGAACACLLPASRILCEKLTERPIAIVPVLCGIICVAILVQLGGDQSYEFIYFRF